MNSQSEVHERNLKSQRSWVPKTPYNESFSSYMNVIHYLRSMPEQATRHTLTNQVALPHTCASFRCPKHRNSELIPVLQRAIIITA